MKLILRNITVLIADGTPDSQGEVFRPDHIKIAGGLTDPKLPVSIGFDVNRKPVGWVTLRVEGDRLLGDFEILAEEELIMKLGLVPCVGGAYQTKDPAQRESSIEVYNVGLCETNADPRIKSLKEQSTRRRINDMFHVNDEGRLVKTSNGEPVPPDEPVFILRGRDSLALLALNHYHDELLEAGGDPERVRQHEAVIAEFISFATKHAARMKIPGSTRGR